VAELPAPAPDRFVGEKHATLGQQQLHVSQAQAEHVIEPDHVADDLGREAMAVMRVCRGDSPHQSDPPLSPS
jgi:hypothetical protein